MEGRNQSFWALFSDCADNSTVHGLKYVGGRRRHWAERIFWMFAFVLSVYGCSIMIYKIYERWQYNPFIVSFAEQPTPIWLIPFPAVTICPETKAMRKYVNFTTAYIAVKSNTTDVLANKELRALEAVAQICDPHLLIDSKINSGLETDEIVPLLKKMSLSLNETTLFCKWRNEIRDCSEFFTEVITEEGICYTFNALDSSEIFKKDALAEDFKYLNHNMTADDWTLQEGYRTTSVESYPFRVLGPGARAGFNIVLKLTEPDLDYMCRGPVQGFKILLHTPGEIPRVSKQNFRVPLRQEVVVSVKPNMITTEGLRDSAPERRQCYFDHERDLKFFKIYTQANCELECLANFTLHNCGCVKFSMPRDGNTSICSQAQVGCYDAAEDGLLLVELNEHLNWNSNQREKTRCNCMPSCTSIKYDAEISQAAYEFKEVFDAFGEDMNEFPDLVLARLTIFFKEAQFNTLQRSEHYGLTDFIANCGGLLSLFMGVSILSLVELLYYMTVRLACKLNTRNGKLIEAGKNGGADLDHGSGIKIDSSAVNESEKQD